jgi:tRNA 2-selenouridine synthase
VLSDEERARVGTLYCQVSPFAARRLGAVLVARNIALHIEQLFQDRPKSWRPLVYCWRGGQRSGAMAIILGQIGWSVHQLEHGYKAYRQQVLADLEQLPCRLDLRVLCGPSGSGKSRMLAALARNGRQTVDLEALACHRGSVLGEIPGAQQPSQKSFESALCLQLKGLMPSRPVYIEAESRNIGRLSLPNALLAAMRAAPCLLLDVPLAERVRFLLEDYALLTQEPQALTRQLQRLQAWHPGTRIEQWQQHIGQRDYPLLVAELLQQHYDPLYQRSTGKHYRQQAQARRLRLPSLTPQALNRAAIEQFG